MFRETFFLLLAFCYHSCLFIERILFLVGPGLVWGEKRRSGMLCQTCHLTFPILLQWSVVRLWHCYKWDKGLEERQDKLFNQYFLNHCPGRSHNSRAEKNLKKLSYLGPLPSRRWILKHSWQMVTQQYLAWIGWKSIKNTYKSANIGMPSSLQMYFNIEMN